MILKTCCCGCTLKTGTLIIGYISLVGNIIVLISSVIIIAWPSDEASHIEISRNNFHFTTDNDSPSSDDPDLIYVRAFDKIIDTFNISEDRGLLYHLSLARTLNEYLALKEYHEIMSGSNGKSHKEFTGYVQSEVNNSLPENRRTGEIIGLVTSCIGIVLTGMLVGGANKGSPWLMLPWIALAFLIIIFYIIVAICLALLIIYFLWLGQPVIDLLITELFFVPSCGIELYCFLVVISYYQKLRLVKVEEQSNLLPMHLASNPINSYSATIDTLPKVPEKEGP